MTTLQNIKTKLTELKPILQQKYPVEVLQYLARMQEMSKPK